MKKNTKTKKCNAWAVVDARFKDIVFCVVPGDKVDERTHQIVRRVKTLVWPRKTALRPCVVIFKTK